MSDPIDTINDTSVGINNQLVLIGGESGAGKSASLRNIVNQPRWMYLNTESNKRLPFKNTFNNFAIDDPYQVHEAFDAASEGGDLHGEVDGIIIDSMTFLMDMFESQYVLTAANTMAAWGAYQQFFKTIMQDKVIKFGKPVIILAHILDVLDEKAMEYKTSVPIKGALRNNGIEA